MRIGAASTTVETCKRRPLDWDEISISTRVTPSISAPQGGSPSSKGKKLCSGPCFKVHHGGGKERRLVPLSRRSPALFGRVICSRKVAHYSTGRPARSGSSDGAGLGGGWLVGWEMPRWPSFCGRDGMGETVMTPTGHFSDLSHCKRRAKIPSQSHDASQAREVDRKP